MSTANLTLVFDGPTVEKGEIDVQDLAPALLAVGGLIQAANNEINGGRAQIAVKVQATAEGSFEVDLQLMQSFLENAKSLLDFMSEHEDRITAAEILINLLFGTGGVTGVGVGLFKLIKFLKGRKPDKIEQKGNNVNIYIEGTHITINEKTKNISENLEVKKQMKKVVRTLSKEGIDKIKFKRADEEDLEITKSEIDYFEDEESEEELDDTERQMTLQIISLSFKEDNKWRMTDGEASFSVIIEDAAFLKKIDQNEIAFSKGDCLTCKVHERQFFSSGKLKTERHITEVIKHKQPPQQTKIL